MLIKPAKARYTEIEAARKLGVSVEQLRTLVKRHISLDEELPDNATFQPADLIVLGVLARRQFGTTVQ